MQRGGAARNLKPSDKKTTARITRVYLSELDAQRSLYEALQQVQIVRLQRFENLVTIYKTLADGLRENTVSEVPVIGQAHHDVGSSVD